jgi:hypothetical protein
VVPRNPSFISRPIESHTVKRARVVIYSRARLEELRNWRKADRRTFGQFNKRLHLRPPGSLCRSNLSSGCSGRQRLQ